MPPSSEGGPQNSGVSEEIVAHILRATTTQPQLVAVDIEIVEDADQSGFRSGTGYWHITDPAGHYYAPLPASAVREHGYAPLPTKTLTGFMMTQGWLLFEPATGDADVADGDVVAVATDGSRNVNWPISGKLPY